MGCMKGVGWVCLLLVACLSPSVAGIACDAPCSDASNSKFARVPTGGTALDEYIVKPDSVYGWRETGKVLRGVLPFSTWTGHVLNMTSQRWLTPDDTSCSVWSHHLVVIVPSNLRYTESALLLVTQGSNGGPPPTAFDSFVLMAAALAVKTHSMTAVLYQVPNQPCIFSADPDGRPRSEDALIAFTWRHFLDHTHEVEWPARLPMVKAAVCAMDTVQAYVPRRLGNQIKNFAVVGASKRGWVTWLTAAVDKRVTSAIPIVMDLLNASSNLAHFYRSLGGWPFTFGDYFDLNVTRDLDTPAMDKLWALVDPYHYRERLTMPKMVVTTSQDEFFLIDDSRFFWEALPGEKHALILANTEHTLITSIGKLVRAVAAFHLSVIDSQGPRGNGWKAAPTQPEMFPERTGTGLTGTDSFGGREGKTEWVRNEFGPALGGSEIAYRGSGSTPEETEGTSSAAAAAAHDNRGAIGGESGSPNRASTDVRKSALRGPDSLEKPTEEAGSFLQAAPGNEGELYKAEEVQNEKRGTSEAGPLARQLEADDDLELHRYRLCGTAEGLRTLHKPLLDVARPWRYRWLEGILAAFGGEDLARRRGRGTEYEMGVQSVSPSEGARDGMRNTGGLESVGDQPGTQESAGDQLGEQQILDSVEGQKVNESRAVGGHDAPLSITPTDVNSVKRAEYEDQSQSREEADWERDCATLVRAREGGLLQSGSQTSGTPLGSGPGRARPKYRYELHRAEGRIEIFCNNVPDTIIQWSAYTPPGSDRRDFRFVTRDYGNCSTFRFGGGCVQPFCFAPRVLKPSGPNLGDGLRYQATLHPPERGYGAFFVEMRWRGLWDRPLYVFSTPALVVPDTYPVQDCRAGHGGSGCTGHLL